MAAETGGRWRTSHTQPNATDSSDDGDDDGGDRPVGGSEVTVDDECALLWCGGVPRSKEG